MSGAVVAAAGCRGCSTHVGGASGAPGVAVGAGGGIVGGTEGSIDVDNVVEVGTDPQEGFENHPHSDC